MIAFVICGNYYVQGSPTPAAGLCEDTGYVVRIVLAYYQEGLVIFIFSRFSVIRSPATFFVFNYTIYGCFIQSETLDLITELGCTCPG